MTNRKNLFVSTVRTYLQQNKIIFNEYCTDTGSHYFHIMLENSNPCIRISNHQKSNRTTYCTTLLYNCGKNTPAHKIKERVETTVKNTINRSRAYGVYRALEALNG